MGKIDFENLKKAFIRVWESDQSPLKYKDGDIYRNYLWEPTYKLTWEETLHGETLSNVFIYQKDGRKPAEPNATAVFSLTQMPGCCGICISHEAQVYSEHRSKGYGKRLTRFRMAVAKEAGYKKIICTTVATNVVENHILIGLKWRQAGRHFRNSRTDNDVILWEKEL
jgi:GNAT superfamily N-acetyltransferase